MVTLLLSYLCEVDLLILALNNKNVKLKYIRLNQSLEWGQIIFLLTSLNIRILKRFNK